MAERPLALPPRRECGVLCKRCEEIDVEIAYFRQRLASVDDLTAIGMLGLLIENLESEKADLHPVDE